MTWHPTTNLIQTGLLTLKQRDALKAWPHGYELYASGVWVSCLPVWSMKDDVYRGKPAPVVTSVWFNRYRDAMTGPYYSREEADDIAWITRVYVLRIDTCNSVSTAHLEGLKW
jgi:hypothetical protein